MVAISQMMKLSQVMLNDAMQQNCQLWVQNAKQIDVNWEFRRKHI